MYNVDFILWLVEFSLLQIGLKRILRMSSDLKHSQRMKND